MYSPKMQKRNSEMRNHYTIKRNHLTLAERRLINRWKVDRITHHQIAERLRKAHQNISNQIKHGLVRQ